MNDKPHKNLIAWQKSMELVVGIYEITKHFPKEEIYGLSAQLRRAAVSVPSNISEGAADRTTQQFSNFLSNAIGSLNEIDTQLDLAHRLGYLIQHDYSRLHRQLDESLALTYGLRKSLASRSKRSQRRDTRKIDPSAFAEYRLSGKRT
jgi:four helix bundle protein